MKLFFLDYKDLQFDFLSLCLCTAEGHYLPVSCFKVVEGAVASLSCQYSVKRYGLSRVCWGRGCGTFWCSNILVQTDEHGIISKVSLSTVTCHLEDCQHESRE